MMSLADFDKNFHVSLQRFVPPPSSPNAMSYVQTSDMLSDSLSNDHNIRSLQLKCSSTISYYNGKAMSKISSAKRLVDRVHRHIFGHATYSKIRALIIGNRVWTNQFQHYFLRVSSSCNILQSVRNTTPRPSCISLNPQPPTKRSHMYRPLSLG